MRLVHLSVAIWASICICLVHTQEDEIIDDESEEITEPPRSLLRPRRPLKLNRLTSKPPVTEVSDSPKNQTLIATTTAKVATKRPSRSRSKTTTAKVTTPDENITETKRPPKSRNRNRNNKNRSRNRNKSRSRTTTQLPEEDGSTSTISTSKNSRRRGNTGRRTTTPKSVQESVTKSRETKSRGNNRKRTTTQKSKIETTSDKTFEATTKKPAIKSQRFQPRPLATIKTPSFTSTDDVEITPPPPQTTRPQDETILSRPKGDLGNRRAEEVPLKRPLPLEGAIIEEPLKPSLGRHPIPSDRLKWEPIETKIDVEKPKSMQKEEPMEEDITTMRPKPAVKRPLLPRTSPATPSIITKSNDDEDEEELNFFSKPDEKSSPTIPVGVPPKPIGPISFKPRPKKLPEKNIANLDGFKPSKSASPKPLRLKQSTKEPFASSSSSRSPKAIKIKDNISDNLDEKSQAINDENEEVITKLHARTPYPLRLDDGTYLGSPNSKSKRPNSAIFSPFEEDELDDEEPTKTTGSVFKLKDDRHPFRVKPIKDNLHERRTTQSPVMTKPTLRVKNKKPTERPQISRPKVTPSTFRPSKRLDSTTPILIPPPVNQARSILNQQTKFKNVDEKIQKSRKMTNDDKTIKVDKMTTGGIRMKEDKMINKGKMTMEDKSTKDDEMMVDEEVMEDEKMMDDKEMMKDEKMMRGKKLMTNERDMADPKMMKVKKMMANETWPAEDDSPAPILVPPRSRYLNFTKLSAGDVVPPIKEDPFSVPTPDIGRIPAEDDELLVPTARRQPIPTPFDGPLLPALPRRPNDGVLTLEPITSGIISPFEEDFDSLDLPPTRKIPSIQPAMTTLPSIPMNEKPSPIRPMQIEIESPFFVIRKPVNHSAQEAQKSPTARSRNPEVLDEREQLTHNPKTLAAALPPLERQNVPVDSLTPAYDRIIDESVTKNMKSRVISTLAPIVNAPSSPAFDDFEEYEVYDDEV